MNLLFCFLYVYDSIQLIIVWTEILVSADVLHF